MAQADAPPPLHDLAVGRISTHAARAQPHKVAINDGTTTLTYGQLNGHVNGLASALIGMGVSKGDVVAAYLPNCIPYVLVVLAVARAGGIFSPVNPRFKTSEIAPILARARPRVVFTTGDRVANLRAAIEASGGPPPIIISVEGNGTPEAVPFDSLLHTQPGPLPAVAETDFFSLMFTSGTTGRPKGALATHQARMLWVLNACIQYSLSENDVCLGTMPLVHSAGLTFTLMHLYVGGTVQILRHFDPRRYLELVEDRQVTSSLVVPTMIVMILEELKGGGRTYDLSNLRRLVTCGSPLQPTVKRRVMQEITDQLYDYYGSTESNSMTVLKPVDQLRKLHSVGQPFPNVEIRIMDSRGEPQPVGERGEVWCRNPSLMSCYLDQPEETAAAFTDGWFHTGDLGYLDDEGYLYLVGRKGDVIISGGVNIYPGEIEQVLMTHPGILDCAVVSEPDPKWGQCVAAYVVPKAGWDLDLPGIQDHCTKTLADYKKPRRIRVISEIPKNIGGKTVKAALAGAR